MIAQANNNFCFHPPDRFFSKVFLKRIVIGLKQDITDFNFIFLINIYTLNL